MDELAQLMDELSLALKKRAEVGHKTEHLVREVRDLPNLSVVAASSDGSSQSDDIMTCLPYKLQLQNLTHAKQVALDAMAEAVSVVSHIRQTVNDVASQSDDREAELVEDYTERIHHEQDVFAEIQERKRDALFELARKLQTLQRLEQSATLLSRKSMR